MKANTLVMPISWEQIEPVEGKFDFSLADILVKQARENKVRLGLLWFGTWKNTGHGFIDALSRSAAAWRVECRAKARSCDSHPCTLGGHRA
jgi:beta-galactosidase GanA